MSSGSNAITGGRASGSAGSVQRCSDCSVQPQTRASLKMSPPLPARWTLVIRVSVSVSRRHCPGSSIPFSAQRPAQLGVRASSIFGAKGKPDSLTGGVFAPVQPGIGFNRSERGPDFICMLPASPVNAAISASRSAGYRHYGCDWQ